MDVDMVRGVVGVGVCLLCTADLRLKQVGFQLRKTLTVALGALLKYKQLIIILQVEVIGKDLFLVDSLLDTTDGLGFYTIGTYIKLDVEDINSTLKLKIIIQRQMYPLD